MCKINFDVQLLCPDDYSENNGFRSLLKSISEMGFTGIELNCANPLRMDVTTLIEVFAEEGLGIINFASGYTAKNKHLSLTSDDETIRERSCEAVRMWRRHFNGTGIEIIFGFIKSDPRYDDKLGADDRLKKSFDEILSDEGGGDTKLVLEATNHYESYVINRVDEAAAFIHDYAAEGHSILPDTYHMNIEEVDMYKPLEEYMQYIHKIHFSDNNRYFPGYGRIDFNEMYLKLRQLKYQGRVGVEGNTKENLIEDLTHFPILIK